MRKSLQGALLAAYRSARRLGVFDTRMGRAAFVSAYRAYKTLWEANPSYLRPYVAHDSWIVDVGANIGFFTERFCEWVSGSGRVLAFEPESKNYDELMRRASKKRFADRLVAVQSLVSETDGTLLLSLNPDNPADHRIGASGVPTRAVRLDTVMADRGWPAISLIKIDVQGAEERVLAGAMDTVRRNHPVLMLEIDDGALRSFGSSAESLLAFVRELGYVMHRVHGNGLRPMDGEEATRLISELGYADLIFLPERAAA